MKNFAQVRYGLRPWYMSYRTVTAFLRREEDVKKIMLWCPRGARDEALLAGLRARGWDVEVATDPDAAREILRRSLECGVALADLRGVDAAALDLMQPLCANREMHWIGVIVPDALENAQVCRFLSDCCYDYHTDPVDMARLEVTLGRARGMARLRRRAREATACGEEAHMVGTSLAMREVFSQIRKLAMVDAPVLITGESGTGKELAATAIHERSPRCGGPFVAVNCAALPPTLIQAELFGHEKGAFTGATQRKIGRIEAASGGTLFLDEIGELPLELQGHLLRFLQDGTVQRLGNSHAVPVDVRVIAATNVDVEQAMASGRLREDLYYRLNVLRLHLPPLRARSEDIELLARFFLHRFSSENGGSVAGFNKQALAALREHPWPGNVRELINRVRRAMVMSENRLLTPEDLGLAETPAAKGANHIRDARVVAEKEALQESLRRAGGNVSRAARALGISRVTLYRLLNKHNLRTPHA